VLMAFHNIPICIAGQWQSSIIGEAKLSVNVCFASQAARLADASRLRDHYSHLYTDTSNQMKRIV
jgi:hypothetical protein